MPRSMAWLSWKEAVKLTSRTRFQSSSFMRMARPSRVRPALLIRMSIWPSAASASFASCAAPSFAPRSAGVTCVRSPSVSRSASSGSTRVPDKATAAPLACSAAAIAPPIPPDAPVISADFPVRSNIFPLPSTVWPSDIFQERFDVVR